MMAAGSEGVRRSMRKTSTATISITGIVASQSAQHVGEHRLDPYPGERRYRSWPCRRIQAEPHLMAMFQNTGAGRLEHAVDVLAHRRA